MGRGLESAHRLFCRVDLRTASKEANNPIANDGRNVKSADFEQVTYDIKSIGIIYK